MPKKVANTSIFLGSVDDLLSQAIANNPKNSHRISLPGDVEFLCSGNPCVAFSKLNSKRETEAALKNQSYVASVASYIDFYRPKYAFLENVAAMASGKKSSLSQLVCALVSIRYQLQLFRIDAWSCGSPQSRSRLIISLAAPYHQMPSYPALSHSHRPEARGQSLGKLRMVKDMVCGNSALQPFVSSLRPWQQKTYQILVTARRNTVFLPLIMSYR